MPATSKLQGVCPIVAAPFSDNGELDCESLRNLIAALATGGCNAVTLFGIAGEYYKLTDREQEKMAAVVIETAGEYKIPAILSVTQHATEVAVKQAQYYEALGANYLMVLPPFFLKPGGDEICQHIKAVCQSVKIPVIVQYAPEQTGVSIAPGILAEICRTAPNARYFKVECKPAGGYISKLLSLLDGNADVLLGNAGYQFIEGFDRGAVGMMPGCSMYDIYLQAYEAYQSGQREEAKRIFDTAILPILNHIRQNVEMIIAFEKKILKKRGIIASDYCRRPTFATDPYFDKLFEEYYAHIQPYFRSGDSAPGQGGILCNGK